MARRLPRHVRTRAQARSFFAFLYEVDEVSFHPDDSFWNEEDDVSAYGSAAGPLYTRAQARVRQRLLGEAWGLLGNDVYEVSMSVERELGGDPAVSRDPTDLPPLPEHVRSRVDLINFFRYLYEVDEVSFHPADRFWNEERDSSAYVNEEGDPLYTRDQARTRDALMEEAFSVPGDVYALAVEMARERDLYPKGRLKRKRKGGRKHWDPE